MKYKVYKVPNIEPELHELQIQTLNIVLNRIRELESKAEIIEYLEDMIRTLPPKWMPVVHKITLKKPNKQVFDLAKGWLQLEAVEETAVTITIKSPYERVAELMLWQVREYCKRHKITCSIERIIGGEAHVLSDNKTISNKGA